MQGECKGATGWFPGGKIHLFQYLNLQSTVAYAHHAIFVIMMLCLPKCSMLDRNSYFFSFTCCELEC